MTALVRVLWIVQGAAWLVLAALTTVAAHAQTPAQDYTAARTEAQIAQDKLTAAGNTFLLSQIAAVAQLAGAIEQLRAAAEEKRSVDAVNFNSLQTLINTMAVRLNALEAQGIEQAKANAAMLAKQDAILAALSARPAGTPVALTDDQFRALFVGMVNARLAQGAP